MTEVLSTKDISKRTGLGYTFLNQMLARPEFFRHVKRYSGKTRGYEITSDFKQNLIIYLKMKIRNKCIKEREQTLYLKLLREGINL